MVDQIKDVTIQIFKGKFIAFFTVFVTAFAFLLLYKMAFTPTEQLNEHSGVIIGFVTGTVISGVIGFWFGASAKPDEENKPKT